MTPEEMRQVANEKMLTLMGAADAWEIGAEICERMDKIIERLDQPFDAYTKEDDGMVGR